MNFSTMEYFVTLAQERNFTKAADHLHIAQQSLSSHIAGLEKELGCQLFVRRNPLTLTYAGEVMLRYATAFQKEHIAMQKEFCDISQNQCGILRVGTSPTRARVILPDMIRSFQTLFPNIYVEVNEAPNSLLFQSLQDGELDLVIAVFPESLPDVVQRDFYREEVVLLIEKELFYSTYGSDADSVERLFREGCFRELGRCPFVLGGVEDIDGKIGRATLNRAGIKKATVKVTSHSMGPLLTLCLRGVGAYFCPENLARASLTEEQLASLMLFKLGEEAQYPVRFGYQMQSYQWSVIQTFMSCAETVL